MVYSITKLRHIQPDSEKGASDKSPGDKSTSEPFDYAWCCRHFVTRGYCLRGPFPHANRLERGFTLIETLVALLVIAIAYAGVATAVSRFVDQRLLLVERHSSHRIAWNRLMEQYMVSQGIQLDEQDFAEAKGETEQRGNRWHWQVTEEKTASGDLVRFQVDVYSADRLASAKGSLFAKGSSSAKGSSLAKGFSSEGLPAADGSLTAYFVP